MRLPILPSKNGDIVLLGQMKGPLNIWPVMKTIIKRRMWPTPASPYCFREQSMELWDSMWQEARVGGGHTDTAQVVVQPLAQWLVLQPLLGRSSHSCTGAGTAGQAPVGLLGWWQLLMLWKKLSFTRDPRLWLVSEFLLKSRFCDFSQLI